ncbi:MAG: ABC transporter ATP-binding protein [Desulfurococcus sp.]|uniref:ABC transporter ATP-binding protein n=1 Tax=Desulfurococcus sp. TaxID=51678 RepID=UPI00316FFCD1
MKTVEMHGIRKIYPDGVIALHGVDFEAEEGEIHGLLGENGAGKTTLMRILYGEIRPTEGEIKVLGKRVRYRNPRDAIKQGMAMIYQHFSLVPTMTVLDNLYLALATINPRITRSEVEARAKKLIGETGLKIPLDKVVEELPAGVQQRVEILKALIRDARILILDEPTSVLTPLEVEELFQSLKRLKEKGMTIILITHKLREVKAVTDRVTVLRRGVKVGTVRTSEVTEAQLARMMVARDVELVLEKPPGIQPGREVLRIEDLWVRSSEGVDVLKGINLSVREGEIIGVAGVQGNGQTELAEAIAGLRRPYRGRIILDSRDITMLDPMSRYKLGISYVPESRRNGLIHEMNIIENSVLTSTYSYIGRYGFIDWGRAVETALKIIREYDINPPNPYTMVKHLSGGNQQKLLVGRELVKKPRILVVSEPTQGVDVASTEFIRRKLLELKTRGVGILLISTDLDEVIQLSDRIIVMYEGRVIGEGRTEEFTLEKLGLLMGGVSA